LVGGGADVVGEVHVGVPGEREVAGRRLRYPVGIDGGGASVYVVWKERGGERGGSETRFGRGEGVPNPPLKLLPTISCEKNTAVTPIQAGREELPGLERGC